MKFQIQRVSVTFTVTMSKMLLVISQLIRSCQKGRHLLMELLLPDIPKDKFTTSWLKEIMFYQSPYFKKGIMSSEAMLLEYCCSVITHGYHLPPVPATGLVSSFKNFIFRDIQHFASNSDNLKIRLIAIPKLVVTSHNKLAPKKVQLKH